MTAEIPEFKTYNVVSEWSVGTGFGRVKSEAFIAAGSGCLSGVSVPGGRPGFTGHAAVGDVRRFAGGNRRLEPSCRHGP
ncbi:hypothetical protein KL86PLE_100113 [uncultured Pleomorphomonas sp.]|uniref:Uncharacterized protein n=1 Tax=uncultured Pleomorphomonas sp. TaxID=442121 RepID=A0A212L1I9_9HYPH|nr:hypothetical protein KL86PLE_100113 [uncultured Pleomorphomonas sp.]